MTSVVARATQAQLRCPRCIGAVVSLRRSSWQLPCTSRKLFSSKAEVPAPAPGWCDTLSSEECALAIRPRSFIQALRIANAQPEELKKAFHRLDMDSSGQLSASELKTLMTEVKGSECSEEEVDYAVDLLLCKYDTGRDGKLSFEEFEAAVTSLASQVDGRAYSLAAAIGVAFMGFSAMFPMGPLLISTFGMTQLQFGTLTTAFAVAKLGGNIPSSILSEAYGRKPLLVGGLLCVGVGMGGVGLASSYEQLMVLRLAVGLGVASTFTAAGMYVTDISHPLNSARTRAPMQMGMSAGMLIGPAMGGYLLDNLGLQSTALGVGAATFLTASAIGLLLPESLQRQAGQPMRSIKDTVQSWAPILKDPHFRKILSFGWCYNAAFWGGMSLLPLIYVDLAMSPSVVGAISTANASVSLIATPLVASVADRYGKMSVVVPGAVIYGAGLILVPQASSLIELLPVLAGMQVGGAMCSQAQMHAMDLVPARERAKVPGLWNTFGDTGMLLSSFASALLAQTMTTSAAFCGDGTLLLVATAALMVALRPRAGRF